MTPTVPPTPAPGTLFDSFWMGGFEGADHVNSHGEALSMNHMNGHWHNVEHDYRLLAAAGIRTVRESIGWRISTANGLPDLRQVRHIADVAAEVGVQVIWSVQHYGTPDGVDPFAPDFAERFADFCHAVARALHGRSRRPTVYQPINEISFLSWALGNTALMHPHIGDSPARGHDAKCNLVRAALQGCDALWSVEPSARMVHNDPLIHVAPVDDASVLRAGELTAAQYEAWDMLAGRSEAGLGGAPRYLDVIGINYYHSNQWLHPGGERLHWHLGDPRRIDLADMLDALWQRYGRPQFIAETGHVGAGRAAWLDEVGTAGLRCRERGIPLEGICLYPLVDRPDWEDTWNWHHSGLWRLPVRPGPTRALPRSIDRPYAARLAHWQVALGAADAHDTTNPPPVSARPPSFINHSGHSMTHLIAFSHLRWDFVYQRPQHLLSRLAGRFPVVFVEEPVPNASRPWLERLHPCEGVEVLRPHLVGASPGFHDDHIPALQTLLAAYLREHAIDDYALWFYTPMAVPLAATLSPRAVVYDCMDELAAFKNAPRQLLQRENALFKLADMVFTGGMSLYEAKQDRHAEVHCFPSSVDAAHFAPGDAPGDAAVVAVAGSTGRPQVGYYGVIDERIDLALVASLASARPAWDLVMVGPVVKIDPATLPQAPNLSWVGQRSYDELPGIVAGWDVCLLPFALNESTRFISPTKTLEYLAAGKASVSTPIFDVVRGYTGVVAIARTAEEFLAACDDALARSDEQRRADALRFAEVVALTSWERTVEAMAGCIDAHLRSAQPAAHVAPFGTETPTEVTLARAA